MWYAVAGLALIAGILYLLWKSAKAKLETAELKAEMAEARSGALRRIVEFEREVGEIARKKRVEMEERRDRALNAKPEEKVDDIFGSDE